MNRTTAKNLTGKALRQVKGAGLGPGLKNSLDGLINQVRSGLRTINGEIYYYSRGDGSRDVDDMTRQNLEALERKLSKWERHSLGELNKLAQEMRKLK